MECAIYSLNNWDLITSNQSDLVRKSAKLINDDFFLVLLIISGIRPRRRNSTKRWNSKLKFRMSELSPKKKKKSEWCNEFERHAKCKTQSQTTVTFPMEKLMLQRGTVALLRSPSNDTTVTNNNDDNNNNSNNNDNNNEFFYWLWWWWWTLSCC